MVQEFKRLRRTGGEGVDRLPALRRHQDVQVSDGSRGGEIRVVRNVGNPGRKVAEQILQAVATLRDKVEAECDYVGDRFAEEARRIHYGEADDRGIYGEATIEEAIDLGEEGIDIAPLPASPKPDGKRLSSICRWNPPSIAAMRFFYSDTFDLSLRTATVFQVANTACCGGNF